MSHPGIQTGSFSNGIPFARLGENRKPVVVLPGINDALQPMAAQHKYVRWFCESLATIRTVYLLGRKPELPDNCSIRDMARDVATVIETHIGPADVLGVSMGGAVAQELAINHAALVKKLVLGMTAPCMAPDRQPIYKTLRALAEQRDWRELYLQLMETTYGRTRRLMFDTLLSTTDPLFQHGPPHPRDFIVSIDACMAHDARDRLSAIAAPTLILGGTEDRLMSTAGTRELAEGIPNAALHLFDGAGHGAFEQRKSEWDEVIRRFLEPESTGSSRSRAGPPST